MSNSSSTHADAGNMDEARRKGKWALGLSITGIIVTLISVAVIVVLTVVAVKEHTDAWTQATDQWNQIFGGN